MKMYPMVGMALLLAISTHVNAFKNPLKKSGSDKITKTVVNKLGNKITFTFSNDATKTNVSVTVKSDGTKDIKLKRDDEGQLRNNMKIIVSGTEMNFSIDKDFDQTNDYIFIYEQNNAIKVTSYSEAGYAAHKGMAAGAAVGRGMGAVGGAVVNSGLSSAL